MNTGPTAIVSMAAAAPEWTVKFDHADGCKSELQTFDVIAWAATEGGGVQPVCVARAGGFPALLWDLGPSCAETCACVVRREAQG